MQLWRRQVGEAARGVGRAAAAGASKAMELNAQHRVTERAGRAAAAATRGALELNSEHRITERAGWAAAAAMAGAHRLNEEHRLASRVASVGRATGDAAADAWASAR